jgi:hypothetical protein
MLFLVLVAVLALFALGFEGRLSPNRPDPSRPATLSGADLRSNRRPTHRYILPVGRR